MASTRETHLKWIGLSIACFLIGVIAWLPNFIFDYGYPFSLLTFIINPIGVVFGMLGENKFGIIANVIMTFSFFLLMAFGYVFNVFTN